MTTGYNAGLDSSDVVLSYGVEAVWATLPAVAFQAVRMTSEGFSESKSRSRPPEIKSDGQASHAITTQVSAQGALSFGVSYETYDDLLAGLLNGEWATALNIDSTTNDIDATDDVAASGNPGFTSTTADKFNSIKVGQWIRTFGFTNAANNGIFRVTAVVTGASPSIQVAGTDAASIVNESPAAGTQSIRGTMLRNGTSVTTYWFQKKLAAALYLNYPGSYVSGGSLSASLGGFFEGSLNFIAKSEESNTTDQSTGAVQNAPAGRVIDTVNGIQNVEMNDVSMADSGSFDTIVQSIALDITKENARAQYGIGSASAQGLGRGTLVASGTLSVYFRNFEVYNLYKAETDQVVSFRAFDDEDHGYIITLPAATLVNPQIVAGGPDTDLVAEFTLEGNPIELATGEGAFTIQIDKIPESAA